MSAAQPAPQFELIERVSPEALARHPAWIHFESEVDRERVLASGVEPEALEDCIRRFETCGLVPLCPVLDPGALPAERDILLAARFHSAGGVTLDGYLLEPLAFGLFHEGREYSFNRSLPGFSGREARRLAGALGCEVAGLFPLAWELDPRLRKLEGVDREGSTPAFF